MPFLHSNIVINGYSIVTWKGEAKATITTYILKQFKLEWAFLGLNICYFAMTEGKVICVLFLLQSCCISLLLKVWSMDEQRQHQHQLGVY